MVPSRQGELSPFDGPLWDGSGITRGRQEAKKDVGTLFAISRRPIPCARLSIRLARKRTARRKSRLDAPTGIANRTGSPWFLVFAVLREP